MARAAYAKATSILTMYPRDFQAWLGKWSAAMAEGQPKNLQATTQPSMWCRDFLAAVRQVKPPWAATHAIAYKPTMIVKCAINHLWLIRDGLGM